MVLILGGCLKHNNATTIANIITDREIGVLLFMGCPELVAEADSELEPPTPDEIVPKIVLPEEIRLDPGENVIGIYCYTENEDERSCDYGKTWYGFDYLTVIYDPSQRESYCSEGEPYSYPTYWKQPFCDIMNVFLERMHAY
jgi:hypothetical protein